MDKSKVNLAPTGALFSANSNAQKSYVKCMDLFFIYRSQNIKNRRVAFHKWNKTKKVSQLLSCSTFSWLI